MDDPDGETDSNTKECMDEWRHRKKQMRGHGVACMEAADAADICGRGKSSRLGIKDCANLSHQLAERRKNTRNPVKQRPSNQSERNIQDRESVVSHSGGTLWGGVAPDSVVDDALPGPERCWQPGADGPKKEHGGEETDNRACRYQHVVERLCVVYDRRFQVFFKRMVPLVKAFVDPGRVVDETMERRESQVGQQAKRHKESYETTVLKQQP